MLKEDVSWVQILDFPRYVINASGEIYDTEKNKLVLGHQVTGGAFAVRLRSEKGELLTRSVKVLVAKQFVSFDFDPTLVNVDLFDTPILCDNNPFNVSAENIRWRPRWFAWEYTHQFKSPKDWYLAGPLRNFDTEVIYENVYSAGVHHGLLFKDVYDTATEFRDGVYYADYTHWVDKGRPRPVWPTRTCFTWFE